MKILATMSFILIAVIVVFTAQLKEEGLSKQEIMQNLTSLENATNRLTAVFPYSNPYSDNITAKEYINNIANGAVYTLGVEINTLTAATVNYSYEYVPRNASWAIIKLMLIYLILWMVVISVKPVAIIYVITEEHFKKKGTDKWWKSLTIAIAGWLTILAVAIAVVLTI